jgi:hypothetical protein
LEAGPYPCRVIAAFLPKDLVRWKQTDNSTVEFYPFLVIVESQAEVRSIWLPYWHVVTTEGGQVSHPYGQWAPFMDTKSFKSLVDQAREKGYAV